MPDQRDRDMQATSQPARVSVSYAWAGWPGALGRHSLNAVARKLLEEADAGALVVEGGVRTTGARPGRAPKRFRFPH